MSTYFPALKGKMGDWDYYTVKMRMSELAGSVELAQDLYDDRTLSTAMQRILNEGRVKNSIARYLLNNDERFFSSIVIAVKEGDPHFYSVNMDDDPRFEVFRNDKNLTETFGIVHFNGEQIYYALDGQHRLSAIKAVLDPGGDFISEKPPGFENEQITVILVIANPDDTDDWRIRHRRLFSNLNRHAKPTDHCTNIIMDEDDAFAILTRRLVSEYPLFYWPGVQKESQRVKTTKGKNLKPNDPYLTSIESIYDYVKILLITPNRNNELGWNNKKTLESYLAIFPGDEVIEEMFSELVAYWDGLISALPRLKEDQPALLRSLKADIDGDSETENIAYFRPVVLEAVMKIARRLLNAAHSPTSKSGVTKALAPLGKLNWDMYSAPWRHLILVNTSGEEGDWKMRSEDRQKAMTMLMDILSWQLGLDELDDAEEKELKKSWKEWLYGEYKAAEVDNLWQSILDGAL